MDRDGTSGRAPVGSMDRASAPPNAASDRLMDRDGTSDLASMNPRTERARRWMEHVQDACEGRTRGRGMRAKCEWGQEEEAKTSTPVTNSAQWTSPNQSGAPKRCSTPVDRLKRRAHSRRSKCVCGREKAVEACGAHLMPTNKQGVV